MAYIIERKNRFYVVAYDGLDPLTGKERRRWHPAGHDRHLPVEASHRGYRIGENDVGTRIRFHCVCTSGCSRPRKARQRSSACRRARRSSRSAWLA